jgi:hypothetical protein
MADRYDCGGLGCGFQPCICPDWTPEELSKQGAKEPGVYDATGANLIYENGVMRRADGSDIQWPLAFVEEPYDGPIPQGITVGIPNS